MLIIYYVHPFAAFCENLRAYLVKSCSRCFPYRPRQLCNASKRTGWIADSDSDVDSIVTNQGMNQYRILSLADWLPY